VQENIIIFDWLSITSKNPNPQYFIDLLGMDSKNFELVKGAHGYRERLYFSGISIHYDGGLNMGTWLEMSGQGCRTFETLGSCDFGYIFSKVLSPSEDLHITRLDVAFDDHTGILDIDTIFQDTVNQEYISRFRMWEVIKSAKGCTVNIGSHSSDVLIRIYDKAAERKCEDGVHWVRCELQLRNDRCLAFIVQLQLFQGDIGKVFTGVIHNYLRYVVPDERDANRWRWELKPYWANFLDGASKISLYVTPGMEYNLERVKNFVFGQAGNSIDTLIKIIGKDEFYKELMQRESSLTEKQRHLINEHLMQEGDIHEI